MWKKVIIEDELGNKIEEEHFFIKCDGCGKEIDTFVDSHIKLASGEILCLECYRKYRETEEKK